MAAVSSFYEFLIASEAYAGRDNPIVKVVKRSTRRRPRWPMSPPGWSGNWARKAGQKA
jgi:hypothetical protein